MATGTVSKNLTSLPELLSIPELAEYLGVTVQTVYNWRARGFGPPAIRVGRAIKFRAVDVARWLEERQASA